MAADKPAGSHNILIISNLCLTCLRFFTSFRHGQSRRLVFEISAALL